LEYGTESKEWESRFNLEDTTDKIMHDLLVIEGLQGKLVNHVFIDPVADYMEVLSA